MINCERKNRTFKSIRTFVFCLVQSAAFYLMNSPPDPLSANAKRGRNTLNIRDFPLFAKQLPFIHILLGVDGGVDKLG
jgi:hypothetical protein